MLALTKKIEYALIALGHMVNHPKHICSARDIAEQCSIPHPLLMNILKTLSQEELVTSTRGAQGGYRLARRASGITLADIIEALEGPIKLVQCIDELGTESDCCDMQSDCQIRSPLVNIHAHLKTFLKQYTLKDIAQQNSRKVSITVKRRF